MMQVRVLASSSAGNSTLVCSGRTSLLIDCGLGPDRMRVLLAASGLTLGEISAVLLTHTHSDHLHQGMAAALRRAGVTIFCTEAVAGVLGAQMDLFAREALPAVKLLGPPTARIGSLEVEHFPVPHDAPGGCSAFIVRGGGPRSRTAMALATDIGHVEPDLPERLAAADLLIVESNHDVGMLLRSGRPEWLIRRIRTRGHLSNEESGGLLRSALAAPRSRVKQVLLAHLSEQCNTPAIARRTVGAAMREVSPCAVLIGAAPARAPHPAVNL